jgi:hypothetical protein
MVKRRLRNTLSVCLKFNMHLNIKFYFCHKKIINYAAKH